MHCSRCDRKEDIMKTTGGFKLWQIIYPIGIYYVVSSLMYFVLGLFLGDGQQTYMLRQLICSAATVPVTMSFYKQDKIAEQVVYGTEKEKIGYKMAHRRSFGGCGCSHTWHCRQQHHCNDTVSADVGGVQEANESFLREQSCLNCSVPAL